MSLFKKEVIILKESNAAKEYLTGLEKLYTIAPEKVKPLIEKEIKLTKYGIAGEENILFELRHSDMDMVVLQDLYLSTGDISAQIDFFVITPKINFMIECKNLYGNIEITNNGDFIRTFEVGGRKIKEGIYSPITQNERHLSVLKKIKLDENGVIGRASVSMFFETINKSLVVLANPNTILNDRYARKEVKEKVIRADQLLSVIKEMNNASKELKSSMKEMLESGKRMISRSTEYNGFESRYEKLAKMVEEEKKVDMTTEQLQEVKESTVSKDSEDVQVCPRCGKELVLRTAKKGENAGKQFYGCSGFPKCRYVKNME